jgi:hypothetical protein
MKVAFLTAAALVVCAADARADLLSFRAEAHGGGTGGVGMGGDAKDEAFFNDARGGSYGGLVGVEALYIDVWVDHHQIVSGDGLIGTWTQFMTGLDLDYEMRDPVDDFSDQKGPKPQGKLKGYLEAGIGFGFGVGTGQQIDPPLDNSEVSDKGFLAELKFGAGFAMGKVLSLGVSLPISAGYYIKNGFANDQGNHYYGLEGSLMLVLRGKITVK